MAAPDFTETANGYLGTTDGPPDLPQHYQLTAHDDSVADGPVVQTGRLPLTTTKQHVTLALGFASSEADAVARAKGCLASRVNQVAQEYANGWNKYLQSLHPAPPSLSSRQERQLYAVSAMVLAASEDKTYRGAFIASPSIPWAFGTGLINPSCIYHAVWCRDMYEIVTAL